MKNKLKNSIWLFYFKSVSLNKNKMWVIKAFLWVSHGQNIQASKVKHGLPFLKVSGFVSWGQLGNVHFRSFWFQHKKYGEGWVKCVYSDTDSETWQLWSAFGKGKFFFFPLCVEQRFTVSPWLPQLGYITANVEKLEDGIKGKNWLRGKKLDDVIHFSVTKIISSTAKTYKHCIYFLRKCQNDEQQK